MIFIGIGSSIGEAEEIFAAAEMDLEKENITVLKKSKILKNPPYGGVAENEFSNAVWQIETDKNPEELLSTLQKIENNHGRKRDKKWDDRTLDLDILVFNDMVFDTEKLKIPHPEIPKRDFVLIPWSEIVEENFEIPKFGKLKDLLQKLSKN